MANWNLPTVGDVYTNILTYISNRLNDAAQMFDSATVAATNLPTGTKRWNATNKNWESWNGSAWAAMATTYGISITGNAATATTAGACSGNSATSSSCTGNAATASSAAACSGNSATATTATNASGTGTIPKATETGLRIIRGNINADGTIAQGTGFTVAATGTGIRTITFTAAFSANPTVVSTINDNTLMRMSTLQNSLSVSSVVVYTLDPQSGARANCGFSFIAIGPN